MLRSALCPTKLSLVGGHVQWLFEFDLGVIVTNSGTRALRRLTVVATVVTVAWAVVATVPKSSAIPAFSRKYQTSCSTCHNNYPELNDFGEAFKKNGFKFPKDDEPFVKDPPVLLGAKAQKEAFPDAIYPGEIPGSLPIAFRYSGNFAWNAKQPQPLQAAASFVPQTDLFVPNTFTIISAGSFGQNLAFWIDDDISAGGTGAGGGLGDGYLRYNDLGHIFRLPKNALNVRFGQFELDLPFSQARTIYPSAYDVFSETAVAQPSTTLRSDRISNHKQSLRPWNSATRHRIRRLSQQRKLHLVGSLCRRNQFGIRTWAFAHSAEHEGRLCPRVAEIQPGTRSREPECEYRLRDRPGRATTPRSASEPSTITGKSVELRRLTIQFPRNN